MLSFSQFLSEQTQTLYVHRKVDPKDAERLRHWALGVGFKITVPANEMHVTCAFSKKKVDWSKITPCKATVDITAPDDRSVVPLGDKGAVVLKINSDQLQKDWDYLRKMGCSWDFDGYQPHITITYDGRGIDCANLPVYSDNITLGPQIFGPVDDNWVSKLKEG